MGIQYKDYLSAISLYSGIGGLDVGAGKAGFRVKWANDSDKVACLTYRHNVGNHIRCGKIEDYLSEIIPMRGADLLMGGPPCQGISKAGRQNLDDPRTKQLWKYMDVLAKVLPNAFILENVSALVTSPLFSQILARLIIIARSLGYSVGYIVLDSSEYGVPQNRKRVFIIGFRGDSSLVPDLDAMMAPYRSQAKSVRDTLSVLGSVKKNLATLKSEGEMIPMEARILFRSKMVRGKTPETSLLFDGYGRILRMDWYSCTITAYGGNGVQIINTDESKDSWLSWFFKELERGITFSPGTEAHSDLRRITVEEAQLIQTFPLDYYIFGSPSSMMRGVGNAVPCEMAYRVTKMVHDHLRSGRIIVKK